MSSPVSEELAYTDIGSGRAVVLVHGFMFNRHMWESQTSALTGAGYRVIAPDLPGFGDSTLTSGSATMESYSGAVIGLLDRLHTGPVTLVGYSMGGQVAMDVCMRRADLLDRLMLVDTSADPDPAERAQERRNLADRLEREGVAKYAAEFLPLLLRLEHTSTEVQRLARGMLATSSSQGAAAASRARADRPSYMRVLAELSVPARVVVGEHDPFDRGGRAATAMAERLPAGDLAIVPGVGHTPPLEAPQDFNRLLLEFVGP